MGPYIAGGFTGLALALLIFALTPRRVSLARRIAVFESEHTQAVRRTSYPGDGNESAITTRIGAALAKLITDAGMELPSLRASLNLVGKSLENFLATSVMLGILGLLFPLLIGFAAGLAGYRLPFAAPIWLALIFMVVFALMPFLELQREVDKRRRDFRHAVGAFLDLVSMNLSGGRGVPEALLTASEIGTGWAFWRIRDALANARITGQTPWQALGVLGEEVQVNELKDLAAALSLVADDGAKVRQSLGARAASLRRRELADQEGQAGEKSQSMLVAQMVLAFGFLVFLMYPAIHTLLVT
jgi:tight adherence protein C